MTPENHLNNLLHLTRTAAAAGAAVLSRRDGSALDESNKSADGDWVTRFDRDAERAVRDVILAVRPHDVITGEEYGETVPEDPSGVRWSVDPLDGTTNFIRNIVYYCTSVAVADSEGWAAGVVHAPALGRVYWAARGMGAWLEEGGILRRLSGPDPQQRGPLVATGFGYDVQRRAHQLGDLRALMEDYADVRRIGSAALDLCMVADGTLDAYCEFGIQEHDRAAGILIAEEAGCWVHRPGEDPGYTAAAARPVALVEAAGSV
jgi:myo-inositol-1(or 4)-monophosphatase